MKSTISYTSNSHIHSHAGAMGAKKNIINKALENRKVKKIKMADNFILATAQIFSLDIVTRNIKDFSYFTNRTFNPFEEL